MKRFFYVIGKIDDHKFYMNHEGEFYADPDDERGSWARLKEEYIFNTDDLPKIKPLIEWEEAEIEWLPEDSQMRLNNQPSLFGDSRASLAHNAVTNFDRSQEVSRIDTIL